MSNTANTSSSTATGTSAQILKGYIDRIENLEEDKAQVSEDIKDVYNEAAGEGFDKKALRIVIKNRKIDKATRESLEAVVETYEAAIV